MACVTKRRGKWVVDYREYGRRRVVTFPSKASAEKFHRGIKLREVDKRVGFKALMDLPLSEATQRYLDNVTAKKPSKTALVGEKKYFGRLNAFFEGRNVSDISLSDLEELQVALSKRLKNSTVNRHFNCYKHFFSKCVDWGIISLSPADKLTSMRAEVVRRRTVSGKEFNSLLLLAQPWMKRALMFAYFTGTRANEISSLKWQDLCFSSSMATVYSKKGTGDERSRRIPLAPQVCSMLLNLRGLQGEIAEQVFLTSTSKPVSASHLSRETRRLAKKAGLEGVSLHCLRHTFASSISEQGGNLEEVQRLLGHANLSTTQRYLHMSDESLRATIHRLAEDKKFHFED